MNDSSRAQGGLICAGTLIVGLVFAAGLLSHNWWAVAIPVAVLLSFVFGLVFWVGWTIMTVDIDPEQAPEPEPANTSESQVNE